MAKRKWELSYFRKAAKKWIENPGIRRSLLDSPRAALGGAFGGGERVDTTVALQMGYLATWEGRLGVHLVFENNLDGWTNIKRGFLLKAWATCLRRAIADRKESGRRKRWEKDAPLLELEEPNILTLGIFLHEDAFVTWVGDRVLKKLDSTNGSDKSFYTTPFIPYVMQLYARWKSRNAKFRGDQDNPLGVYSEIFTHWQTPQFGDAVQTICDYHCLQSFDNAGFPEFVYPPDDVLPSEILALRRIRIEAGLEFPAIHHVLFENNRFLELPATFLPLKDDLIEKVTAQLKNDYPEIDCL